MRCLERNKQCFWYCLYSDNEIVYDEYGNEVGDPHVIYEDPVRMYANISPAQGYAQTEQFGNLADYDKVIVTDNMDCPIDEHTVLFVDKYPEYNTENDLMFDYVVRRVAKSLNSISIAIRKVETS